jgi:hypothetical protein
VIMVPSLLLPFLCVLWIPQIFENIINHSSKAPSILYLICVSIEHLYIPVLLLTCSRCLFHSSTIISWSLSLTIGLVCF